MALEAATVQRCLPQPHTHAPPHPPPTNPHPTHHTTHPVQVDDSGKVQRLRKVCPQCGPGIFMATAFNRVYCGKCHLTYVYQEGQTA